LSDGNITSTSPDFPAVVVTGNDVKISEVSLDVSGGDALGAANGVSNVTLEGVTLGAIDHPLRGGYGLRIDRGAHDYWTIDGCTINSSQGYGILTGSARGEKNSGMRVLNSTIHAHADAIELNAPDGVQSNTILSNLLLKTYGSYQKTSGFSIGAAHVQGFVFSNWISESSTQEALHIEDGSRLGVVSSFVVRNNAVGTSTSLLRAAINHYATGANRAQNGPIVFCGFALEGSNLSNTGKSYGYRANNNDTLGTVTRSPIVAGYMYGFEAGVRIDGPGLFPIGYISLEDCFYGMRVNTGVRAPNSTIYTSGCSTFLQADHGGGEAGFFHEESGNPPSSIILNTGGSGVVGCTVEGFSMFAHDTKIVSPGYGFTALFPKPRRLRGSLQITAQSASGWYFWEGNITFDGATVTVDAASVIYENNGAVSVAVNDANPVIRSDGTTINIGILTTANQTLKNKVKFRGTYYS
jgi:hypothetical protein